MRAERFALIREAIDEYDVDGSESPWELGSFSRRPVNFMCDYPYKTYRRAAWE